MRKTSFIVISPAGSFEVNHAAKAKEYKERYGWPYRKRSIDLPERGTLDKGHTLIAFQRVLHFEGDL